MDKLGYVTARRSPAAEAARPRAERLRTPTSRTASPTSSTTSRTKLIDDYGANTVRNGGLRVYTTIEPRLQQVGLEAMRSALPYSTDPSSALVSIDPDNGHIRAMVSSTSYAQSQFNLAAQGHRQPGSTFKAFVLTTAIKQGIDPYTTYYTSIELG